MSRLLQSNWMIAFLGAILYLATTVLTWHPPSLARKLSARQASTLEGASWNFSNPEVDQLVADLKEQKAALDQREQQLNELDARLHSEWQEIGQATQTVTRLQREFDQTIVRVRAEESVNLKKLAKVYAAMSPEGAASIFKEMEDEQVVKIMVFMKDAETAPILEVFAKQGQAEAKRAAVISDRLRLSISRTATEKTKNS